MNKIGQVEEKTIPVIFIVESDLSVRENFRDIFSQMGWDVTVAVSGKEALRLLEEGLKPDVIVLGFNLTDMTGPMLVRELSLREEWMEIPVINLEPYRRLAQSSPVSKQNIPVDDHESCQEEKATDLNYITNKLIYEVSHQLRKGRQIHELAFLKN